MKLRREEVKRYSTPYLNRIGHSAFDLNQEGRSSAPTAAVEVVCV
jgi:hypothetical protein